MDIVKWKEDAGLALIGRPGIDLIKWAIQYEISPEDIKDEDRVKEYDRVLLVLSNYFLYLQAECGTISARFSYALDMRRNGEFVEEDILMDGKAQLNILRPILDGLKIKIDSLRKIYDMQIRRSYELRNIRG